MPPGFLVLEVAGVCEAMKGLADTSMSFGLSFQACWWRSSLLCGQTETLVSPMQLCRACCARAYEGAVRVSVKDCHVQGPSFSTWC